MFALAETTGLYYGTTPPALPPLSATADATASLSAMSAGSPRSGFFEFGLSTGTLHDDMGVTISIADGVHSYQFNSVGLGAPSGGCHFEACLYTLTVPFDLGTDFTISISASAAGGISPTGHGFGQDAEGALSFVLLESNGTTPVPFSVVPEPSMCLPFIVGLAGIGCFRLARYYRNN
jgi:hypothetical protein